MQQDTEYRETILVDNRTKWTGTIEIITYDCPSCGCAVLDGSNYCSNCGVGLTILED
jgi:uncharacterized OB-fold protein